MADKINSKNNKPPNPFVENPRDRARRRFREGGPNNVEDILHTGLVSTTPRASVAAAAYAQANKLPEYKSMTGERLFRQRFPLAKIYPSDVSGLHKGGYALEGKPHVPESPSPGTLSERTGYYETANHEAEHAYNQKWTTATTSKGLKYSYAPVASEIGPSIGDIIFMSEQFAKEQGKPLQYEVTLPGGVKHDVNWMREQATKHGYWDGRSMDSLLATPEGKQWLNRLNAPSEPPWAHSGLMPAYIKTGPSESQVPMVSNSAEIQRRDVPSRLVPPLDALQLSGGRAEMSRARSLPVGNVSGQAGIISRADLPLLRTGSSVPVDGVDVDGSEPPLVAGQASIARREYPGGGSLAQDEIEKSAGVVAKRAGGDMVYDRFVDERAWSRPMNVAPKPKPKFGPPAPVYTPSPVLGQMRQSFQQAAANPQPAQSVAPVRERVDPRIAEIRASRQRLQEGAARARQGAADMVQAASNPTMPSGPNPLMQPYQSLNRNQDARIRSMAENREASAQRVANPSSVPYGARNVYSPLGSSDAAFFQRSAERLANQRSALNEQAAPRPVMPMQQRIANEEAEYQAARQNNPNLIGDTASDQQRLIQSYGVYRRGFMQNPQGMPMNMAEFADAYRAGDASATAPIANAMQDAAMRRADIRARKEEGMRARQAAAAFAAHGVIPAGPEGERLLAGYAARMNPFAAGELSNNMMQRSSQERMMDTDAAARMGIADTAANAQMYGADVDATARMGVADTTARAQMYGADADAFTRDRESADRLQASMAQVEAAKQKAADELAFAKTQYADGSRERQIATEQAQIKLDRLQAESDAMIADSRRAQDPNVAATRHFMQIRREMIANGADPRDAEAVAESEARIKFEEMTPRGQISPASPWMAPSVFTPKVPVQEGAAKGVMDGAALAKYVADWSASNAGRTPTPDEVFQSLRRDGYSVNEDTLFQLRKNMIAQQIGPFNHAVNDWTLGWFGYVGDRDPLAEQAYNTLVPPSGVPKGQYDPREYEREQEVLRKYGFARKW